MTTGEGLFYGLVFVGLVVLYIATRDRWKWKRITLWAVGLLLVPLIALGGWFGVSSWIDSRPKLQSEFWGLSPGMPASEVLYLKGEPTKRDGADWWLYFERGAEVAYAVSIQDNTVRYVRALSAAGKSFYLPTLQGISGGSSQQTIESKFGKPDLIAISKDRTSRRISYVRFGVVFDLERDGVIALGVIDPARGPLPYSD